MPSPRIFRRLPARAAGAALVATLACAAPALAQDDPGGASADQTPTATATPAPTTTAAPTTTPAPTAAPAVKTLKRGSRGKAVKRLQRKLRLKADGVYGKLTVRAVKRFQKRKGILANGVASAATLQALGLVPAAAKPATESSSVLEAIAACESGGDPTAISRSGTYRGKYQFDDDTWASVGGTGHADEAPEAEQDQRAAQLYAEQGTKPWPVCGPKATGGA